MRLERDGANLLPQKPPVPLWRRVLAQLRDPLLAVAGAFALQLAGLYMPPLRELLGTEPLPLGDLLIVTALSTLGYAAVRLDRILHPSHRRRLGSRPEFKVTAVRPTASSRASETGPRVSSSMGLISSAAGKLMRHGRTSRRRR
ncbi:cation-transporting P-type ATPase [Nonomuraea sp. NPDC048901]|uniref:cation-transporting P-type ATPase n=1 Tax=Nonomuraea sp. NPDC048901 TaxID=3155627 RepID=UPI0033D0CEAF